MGLFSRRVTREFICYKGHVDFFYDEISVLATACLCVYYKLSFQSTFLVHHASTQHLIFPESSFG